MINSICASQKLHERKDEKRAFRELCRQSYYLHNLYFFILIHLKNNFAGVNIDSHIL